MSKNTGASKFRKVNVDDYDENNFQDDQLFDDQVAGPDEGEIQRLLNSKKNTEALHLALKNPPIMSKNPAVKAKAFSVVMRVLTNFKSSEVENAVNSLDPESIDVLMKYIYRSFAEPSEGTAGIMLTWHEKVYAVGGVGCIMRVLTDRKGV
ncbi:actin-related protein 2/3 complex subunit 5-B-like [Diadema setosum]|uniref:actin-related protein 2/3 complex subunit 5-B-like n=1 Tax=Diadema setosum TaxID=31175 RepID=UPI003B3AAB9B